jgi:hypothetical protein
MRHGMKDIAIIAAKHLAGKRYIRVQLASGPARKEACPQKDQGRNEAKQNEESG